MMIKKLGLLILVLLLSLFSIAQTQKGYVKTKGRMTDGKLIPGKGLKGTLVKVHGRNTILVDKDDGKFGFPMAGDQFRIDSVRKKGYQLVDLEVYTRYYKYSVNPLYLVMEDPNQILSDQLSAERTIRHNLQKQLQEKENELESLKAENKISEQEYILALDKLYQDQSNSERLIKDMAKRYAELDYDQLDDFYRQVTYSIECGDLVKADSLLASRGDIVEQVESIKQRSKALNDEKQMLKEAEAVHQADIEEAAHRCYSYHETFSSQHLYDTAAYYLELRASLDTTNIQWLDETGMFFIKYLGNKDKSLEYYKKAQSVLLSNGDINNPDLAAIYNNIGSIYLQKGEFESAMQNLEKSLEIYGGLDMENSPKTADSYDNLGGVYLNMKDGEDTALYYFHKALDIRLHVLGENCPDVANSYNNIGTMYYNQFDYDKALEYYNKALSIRLSIFGKDHPDVAQSYYNIGWWYQYHGKGKDQKALEYYNKALKIWQYTLGKEHKNTQKAEKRIAEVKKKIKDHKR